MKAYLFIAYFIASIFLSCGSSSTQGLQSVQATATAIDEISWRDWGPPVAPQFNNTYIVTLSRAAGTLTIDSVRTAGVEITRSLTAEDFDRILELKEEHNIQLEEELTFDGCIGGNGHTITFKNQGEKVMEGMLVNCGEGQRTNIKGNFMAYIDEIRKLAFPK